MLVLGDREHQGRLEGVEAYADLKKVEVEARASKEENANLRAQVEKLERELSEARSAEERALARVGELEKEVAGFEASKEAIRLEAVDAFRGSAEYADELGAKAAAKVFDTYAVAEKYLKENPEGDFDGFIDVFLATEEGKARAPQDTNAAEGSAP